MNKALLIIDVQQDFTVPNARMPVDASQAKQMIETLNALTARAEKLDLLVVYIGNEYSTYNPLNVFRKFAALRNTPGIQMDPRLNIVSNHYFPKSKDNAFSNPDLSRFLQEQNIKTVILSGLYAEACIWQTLKGAQSAGFQVEILAEAFATKTEFKRRAMLLKYERQGAKLS